MRHFFCILLVLLGIFVGFVARAQVEVDVAGTSVYLPQQVHRTTPTSGTSWDNIPLPANSLPGSGNLPSTGEPPLSFLLFDAPGGGALSAIWYMSDGYDFFYVKTAENNSDFTTLVNTAIASTSNYKTVPATGAIQDVTSEFNSLWPNLSALPDGSLKADIAFLSTPVPEPATWFAGALLACPLIWRGLGSFRRQRSAVQGG